MKTRHWVFLIIAGSWVTLATSYGVNTIPEQSLAQTLGQVSFYLLPMCIVYYGLLGIIEYIKRKLKPKQKNAIQHT